MCFSASLPFTSRKSRVPVRRAQGQSVRDNQQMKTTFGSPSHMLSLAGNLKGQANPQGNQVLKSVGHESLHPFRGSKKGGGAVSRRPRTAVICYLCTMYLDWIYCKVSCLCVVICVWLVLTHVCIILCLAPDSHHLLQ